jgi:hypothetical protein
VTEKHRQKQIQSQQKMDQQTHETKETFIKVTMPQATQ